MTSRSIGLAPLALTVLLLAGCSRATTLADAGAPDAATAPDAGTPAPDAGPPAPDAGPPTPVTSCYRDGDTVICRTDDPGTHAVDDEHLEILELTFDAIGDGPIALGGSIAMVALFYPNREVSTADDAEITARFAPDGGSGLTRAFASTSYALPYRYPTQYGDGLVTGTVTLDPDGCVLVDVAVEAGDPSRSYLYSMAWQGLACPL